MLKLPISMTLPQKFFNCKLAQEKVNDCSKKVEKRRKRKGEKKVPKIEKPKGLKILFSAYARLKMH